MIISSPKVVPNDFIYALIKSVPAAFKSSYIIIDDWNLNKSQQINELAHVQRIGWPMEFERMKNSLHKLRACLTVTALRRGRKEFEQVWFAGNVSNFMSWYRYL